MSHMAPRRNIYFSQPLLPATSVKLGRFVPDIRQPYPSLKDTNIDIAPFKTKSVQHQFTNRFENTTATGSNVQGTAVVYGSLLRNQGNHSAITTQLSTFYQLLNSDTWFDQAIRDPDVQTWVDRELKKYGKMYVIVGFQTVQDAHISEAAVNYRGTAAGLKAPVGAALAGSGLLVSMGELADPAIDTSNANSVAQQRSYVAPGDQVIAVQYRRLRFHCYSSRTVTGFTGWHCHSAHLEH